MTNVRASSSEASLNLMSRLAIKHEELGQSNAIKEDLPLWSGTMATAGGLVFYGTMDGWFKAVDAKTGELKWQFRTGSGIIGQPVAYRGPDGHEYVAILSGVGGWAGAIVAGDLDPRDPTGALGMNGVMADLKTKTAPGGTLYVFTLPRS
jgi:lanthanide-dependent methanol dehydrogenase